MPESGITYVGDWRTPLSHWWIDSRKENKLNSAKERNTTLPIQPTNVDFWDRIK